MAFTNLPANLQDMFYGLSDRVAKLETGPNQAAYTADTAQSTASSAQGSATAAYNAALAAAAQATSAQYTAGIAYSSANNKNTTNYASYTPSPSSNNTNGSTPVSGDLWFVVDPSSGYAKDVYTYQSGSWGHSPLDGSSNVILNIDAGKLVAGTIIANVALRNGGSTFYVDAAGNLTATSATVQGIIRGDSGYFTGTLTSSSGTIAGWQLNSGSFSNSAADTFLYANPGSDGLFISSIGRGIMRRLQLNGSSGTTLGSNTLAVGGTASIDSDATIAGNIRSVGTASTTTSSTANMYINSSSGLMARSTASSQRYKHDIVNLTDVPELDPKALYELPVRAFRFNQDYLPETDDRSDVLVPGFIAEEVDAIYPAAVDYSNGQVETWNDRMLVPGLLALIQDLNNRVKELEAKLSNP